MSEHNKRNAASMILAVVVIAAFGLYMVAFQVPFTSTAVVTRFGEVKRSYSGLKDNQVGLQWKWPWPVEQVTLFDNRIRVYESKLEQLYTADEQSITVTIYTTWRIGTDTNDVLRFLKVVNTPENAESKLAGMAHDAMGKVVGLNSFENFVSMDPKRMKYAAIERQLYDRIAEQARKTYGIEVLSVGISRLELPEEATRKVFDRMSEERRQEAKGIRATGDSEAKQILAQARQDATNIENRARAEEISIRGKGDAEAARYYKVFAENPGLHNFIKYLDALKEILPRRTTLILDAEQVVPFDLLSAKTLRALADTPAPEQSQAPKILKAK
jgi:modulator of FtsH protease HflC